MKEDIKINNEWKEVLNDEFSKSYFTDLVEFLKSEYTHKDTEIYPPFTDIFRSLEMCPPNKVKVVILGQDPYHGRGEANGLAFAVGTGTKIPPSLRNIFKEIKSDLGRDSTSNSDLIHWAEQGVLLLNASLTVRADDPGSHQGRGWEEFTDAVIRYLSEAKTNLVFMLWGNYARSKGKYINRKKHLVLESPHPSPFSAYSGFFGSKPFSKANEYLLSKGLNIIDW